MTLRESLRAIITGWKVVAVAAVLGVLLAGLLSLRTETSYVSSARLFVAAETGSRNAEELFQRNQIATQRLASYVQLVSSDAVADEVTRILDEGSESTALPSSVTASTIPDTVIIDLQVTGPTPEDAQRAAQAYAEAVPRVIDRVEQVGDKHAAQVKVTPIVEPRPGAAIAQSQPVGIGLGALLGLVIGSGIVVIRAAVKKGDAQTPATEAPTRSPSDAG